MNIDERYTILGGLIFNIKLTEHILQTWWTGYPEAYNVRDSKGDMDVKNRLLDSVGEGEGGMTWENSTETCILHMWDGWPVQVWCMT